MSYKAVGKVEEEEHATASGCFCELLGVSTITCYS